MEVKLTPGGSVWMSEASSTSFSSFERKGEFNDERKIDIKVNVKTKFFVFCLLSLTKLLFIHQKVY